MAIFENNYTFVLGKRLIHFFKLLYMIKAENLRKAVGLNRGSNVMVAYMAHNHKVRFNSYFRNKVKTLFMLVNIRDIVDIY